MSAVSDAIAVIEAAYDKVVDDLDAEQAQHALDNQQATARIAALQAEIADLRAGIYASEGTGQ